MDRFFDCQDAGIAAHGIEALDDVRHACAQEPHVADWQVVEEQYHARFALINPDNTARNWFDEYVEPTN